MATTSLNNDLILITGGTGFIGMALIKRFLAKGYQVRVVTRLIDYAKQEELNNFVSGRAIVNWYEGDIGQYSSIQSAFHNVTYVFHAAALLNSVAPWSKFQYSNVEATENICRLCLENDVRKLIYISTADVFGIPKRTEIITENSPYRFWKEPYPDTKLRASEIVREYQKKGLISSIIYPGWVYGPGDRAFFPALVEQMKSGILPIWDDGTFKVNLVYIDDLVEALLSTLTNIESDNEDFLIFDDSSGIRLVEICQYLGKLFDLRYRVIKLPYWIMYAIAWISQTSCRVGLCKKPMLSTTDVKSFGHSFKFSTTKAREKLLWSKQISFQKGADNWFNWYKSNHR